MAVIYNVLKLKNNIVIAHSGFFGKKYCQYYLSIYREKIGDGVRQRLRFSTKQDLINFFILFTKETENEKPEKTIVDCLITTAYIWGGDKKLKTKRLLSQICEDL